MTTPGNTFIGITLVKDLTEEQCEATLASINNIAGVFNAASMLPEIAYAFSDETRNAQDVIADIKKTQGVVDASIPPTRRLIV